MQGLNSAGQYDSNCDTNRIVTPMRDYLMKYTNIFALAGILTLSSTAVFAETPPFKKLDANGDGSVDKAEYAAAKAAGVEKSFAEVDTSKDGMINTKEYAAVLEPDCE